nr:diguanylate cyclase [uncultured Lichenicoccus sp.]
MRPADRTDSRLPPSHADLLASVPNLIAYYDRDQVCRYANDAYLDFIDRSAGDAVGCSMRSLLGDEVHDGVLPYVEGALAGEKQVFDRRTRLRNGALAHKLVDYSPRFDGSGRVLGIVVSISDVTPLRDLMERSRRREAQLEQSLAERNEANAWLKLAELIAGVGHWTVSLPDYKVTWSDEIYRIYGLSPETYRPDVESSIGFYHPDDRRRVQAAIAQAARDGTPFDVSLRLVREDGEVRHVRSRGLATRRPDGRPTSIFGVFVDVTEQREAEITLRRANDRLDELAHIDGLTGVANRRRYDDALDREWRSALRTGRPLSVAIVDVDHFKAYNDTYGHQAGDNCLRALASVLLSVTRRPYDLLARLDGEEFVYLLPATDAEGAVAMAERARAEIEALMFDHSGNPDGGRRVSVSIGVATCTPDRSRPARTAQTLMSSADKMLYLAKRAGRNRVASVPRLRLLQRA